MPLLDRHFGRYPTFFAKPRVGSPHGGNCRRGILSQVVTQRWKYLQYLRSIEQAFFIRRELARLDSEVKRPPRSDDGILQYRICLMGTRVIVAASTFALCEQLLD